MYAMVSREGIVREIFQDKPLIRLKNGSDFLDDEYIANHFNIYPVVKMYPNGYDPIKHNLVEVEPIQHWPFIKNDGYVYQIYNLEHLTFEQSKQKRLDELKNIRKQFQTKGIVINGIFIKSDVGMYAQIDNVLKLMNLNNKIRPHWKIANNSWLEYIAPHQVEVMATCLSDYVEKCFNHEKQLFQQIVNAPNNDYEYLKNIRLYRGWPDNNYIVENF